MINDPDPQSCVFLCAGVVIAASVLFVVCLVERMFWGPMTAPMASRGERSIDLNDAARQFSEPDLDARPEGRLQLPIRRDPT